jgi:hypothetical protein
MEEIATIDGQKKNWKKAEALKKGILKTMGQLISELGPQDQTKFLQFTKCTIGKGVNICHLTSHKK